MKLNFTWSLVRERKKTAKKCTKKCDAGAGIDLRTKSTAFFMLLLHLKLPNLSVFWGDRPGGGGGK